MNQSHAETELIALSKEKWRWMADRDVASLAALLHEEAVFVHMGATLTKDQDLDVIKSGRVQYKRADIHDVSVRFFDLTAILLNNITLLAEVAGNQVTNPFMVTEVYVQTGGAWNLAALTFTRLVTPEPTQ